MIKYSNEDESTANYSSFKAQNTGDIETIILEKTITPPENPKKEMKISFAEEPKESFSLEKISEKSEKTEKLENPKIFLSGQEVEENLNTFKDETNTDYASISTIILDGNEVKEELKSIEIENDQKIKENKKQNIEIFLNGIAVEETVEEKNIKLPDISLEGNPIKQERNKPIAKIKEEIIKKIGLPSRVPKNNSSERNIIIVRDQQQIKSSSNKQVKRSVEQKAGKATFQQKSEQAKYDISLYSKYFAKSPTYKPTVKQFVTSKKDNVVKKKSSGLVLQEVWLSNGRINSCTDVYLSSEQSVSKISCKVRPIIAEREKQQMKLGEEKLILVGEKEWIYDLNNQKISKFQHGKLVESIFNCTPKKLIENSKNQWTTTCLKRINNPKAPKQTKNITNTQQFSQQQLPIRSSNTRINFNFWRTSQNYQSTNFFHGITRKNFSHKATTKSSKLCSWWDSRIRGYYNYEY